MKNTLEMQNKVKFGRDSLILDADQEIDRITAFLVETVHHSLRRQGAVVGISGGIDSAVTLALCARAFGPERVLGIQLPEKESSPENIPLASRLADHFHVQAITEDISPALEGLGCYRRRNEAIQQVFLDYRAGWKVKIVLPGDLLEHGTLNIFKLVIVDPAGNEFIKRLPLNEYYQIVASSNFKQRTRTLFEYYHAELRNYAVMGTPNKNEHELGFFVKYGDGGYDVAPIRHLFKSQVYQLAEALDIPTEICQRPPTTDTYPGGGTQEEFFYRIPFAILDCIWHGFEQEVDHVEIAAALDLTTEQVERVIADIQRKQQTTRYLRIPPLGIEDNH